VQLGEQALGQPAAEETVDRVPGGEVRRHRTPLDAAIDQVEHRVEHLPVAVGLRAAVEAYQPARQRQYVADLLPLGGEIRRIAACPVVVVGGVAEPERETVTRRHTGVGRERGGQTRQTAATATSWCSLVFDIPELFRRPCLQCADRCAIT
jgi:hypothetical protein